VQGIAILLSVKLLRIIHDSDIGSDSPAPRTYEKREAARAIVFDTEGRVALLNATKKGYHKLPGGGVEASESIEQALRRELIEEIGCEVSNIRELGIIEEYRNRMSEHQISHCFIADLAGEKGTPHLEPDEAADGFETEWMDLKAAIASVESEESIEHYEGRFIWLRDLTFLKAAQ
jgi:ADP-ribose pyrophosphatase YjhB (NUDIX family)